MLCEFIPTKITGKFVLDTEIKNIISEVVFDRIYWDKLDMGIITDNDVKKEIKKRLSEEMAIIACQEYDNWINAVNKVKVNKGDVFFIKAGTVHAIGKGIVICEVQQNSNTTYRVYDYYRIDKDGNKRPLHIKQAIAEAETKPAENYKKEGNILAQCRYFTVKEFDVEDTMQINITDESFKSVIVVDGEGEIFGCAYRMNFTKGDSIFIPAQNDTFEIKGKCKIIISYI